MTDEQRIKAIEWVILKQGYIYAPKDLDKLATAINAALGVDQTMITKLNKGYLYGRFSESLRVSEILAKAISKDVITVTAKG